jgi:hypothetical protein
MLGRAGHLARIGVTWNSYRILIRKPLGKRESGRSRRMWKDNTNTDLREQDCDDGR